MRRADQGEKLWVSMASTQVKAVGSSYWRAIGSVEQLVAKAEALGQRWLKGIGTARRLQHA